MEKKYQKTMEILLGTNSARIAPVSRYTGINMGKIVKMIVEAQLRVGIPNEKDIEKLKSYKVDPIKNKEEFNALYKEIEFQEGTRPLLVIEVCYDPKTPELAREYFRAAVKYREEKENRLRVLLGTIQDQYRFDYMIEGGYIPDGVVSTNMAPLREGKIYSYCLEKGIVLGPNIGYSSDNLIEALKSRKFNQEGKVIGGAAIQKLFPGGSVNTKDFLKAFVSTHPEANLMITGGADKYTARSIMESGAALIGASAIAQREVIIKCAYIEVIENKPNSWDEFVKEASIMVTEAHIGVLLRQSASVKEKDKLIKDVEKLEKICGTLS